MNIKTKRKLNILFITGALLFALGFSLYHFRLKPNFSEKSVERFERRFQEKEEKIHELITNFSTQVDINKSIEDLYDKATKLSKKNNIDVFIYQNDSLIIWTNHHVPVPVKNPKNSLNKEVNHLKNGWYYFTHSSHKTVDVYGSFLIKNTYEYQNDDLKNTFANDFKNIINGDILPANTSQYNIKNDEGEVVFSIKPNLDYQPNEYIEIIVFTCFLFGFFIWLQLLVSSTQILLIKKPSLLILYPIVLIFLRYLSIRYNWLSFLNEFKLFSPELFASSELVPSLGDLIINVSIFYFLVHFLLKRTGYWFKEGNQKLRLILYVIPLFILSFFLAFKINALIYALVFDSKINFNLELLFDLDIYSFISIIIIGACFYAYFKFVQFVIIQFKKNNFEWNKLSFLWAILSLVYILIDIIQINHSLITTSCPIILSGILLWFEFKEKSYKFIHVISILTFISFYAAYILDEYSNQKEKELRQVYAEEIATDEDPITEIDYDNIEKKIAEDGFLFKAFIPGFDFTNFTDTIESKYFSQLKNKYDLSYNLFNSKKTPILNYSNIGTVSYESLYKIIKSSGKKSNINQHLFFITNYTEKLSYLSHYPVVKNDSVYGYFMVEMRSKKFPKDIGLPSLLLDNGSKSINYLKGYSVAKYVDSVLVSHKGEFNFPFFPAIWFNPHPNSLTRQFVNNEGYSHYVYQLDVGKYTLLSKKKSTVITLFTAFSYLLIIYGVLLLVPIGYQQFNNKRFSFKNISFNVKIQVVIIVLLLVTLIAFGIGAGTYVVKQYHINSKEFIKEKTGSVQTELHHKLGGEKELKSDLIYLEYLLKKFSRVFVTDINMYDLNGDLLASSQPKIYSKGLISIKMNSAAYEQMSLKNKSEFIHQEQIGELIYLSAYAPFVNNEGKLLAYLNLQYISKQDELENQISGFLLAIINIMVLMLAISIILAITLSNRLTSPLKYIQESLRNVQLGSKSKAIEYDGTDEIGELVKEYNKKVEELQKSAEQLAKSERESAWREMAKQVAHEIKNPLTPMKLSIQHMKRSIEVKDDSSKEKLNRVTASLIEQIDALTKIANEFSNFAKMPKAVEDKVNLVEVIKNAYAVFSDSNYHQIELINHIDGDAFVWADKTLLLRVFNNLIKNAIQAIPQTEEGLIKIILSDENGTYKVEVKDNGVGISDNQAESIFIPYFTTKSTGTGLGLAMTKQIIENMKGQIWFKSKLNKGTRFFVTFPKHN
jgi:signal transduction histidine kinase